MSQLTKVIEDLVSANRILARENILDSFGHISARNPDNPKQYLLSRARAPDCIEADDIMTFELDGTPVNGGDRKPYLERYIHGAIYEARPDVHAVIHSHAGSLIPFGVTGWKMRPIMHICSCIGKNVPIWDSGDEFGDTNLLVVNMSMGRDLVKSLGQGTTALMRGHGCVAVARNIRLSVFVAIQLELNAKLIRESLPLGEIKYLAEGEVERILAGMNAYTWERAWENWCKRAGRRYDAETID
jgi:ribulose-5-phosphate 4-epimerase/fuculose-1-phosphate aldolase